MTNKKNMESTLVNPFVTQNQRSFNQFFTYTKKRPTLKQGMIFCKQFEQEDELIKIINSVISELKRTKCTLLENDFTQLDLKDYLNDMRVAGNSIDTLIIILNAFEFDSPEMLCIKKKILEMSTEVIGIIEILELYIEVSIGKKQIKQKQTLTHGDIWDNL